MLFLAVCSEEEAMASREVLSVSDCYIPRIHLINWVGAGKVCLQ